MRRAVFLDRDGVLNRAEVRNARPHPPQNVDEFVVLPGVPEACHALRDAGLLLVVVTNQPDVARGSQTRRVVEEIHQRLRRQVPFDDVLTCWHDDADNCPCRKPRPGLLLEAAEKWQIDLPQSFAVGDRWRDIAAGQAAGCRTVFIDAGYAERQPDNPTLVVSSLSEAVPWLVAECAAGTGARKE